MAEPRGFVVVGDTDWLDVSRRSIQSVMVSIDSRLRRASLPAFGAGLLNRLAVSAGQRDITGGTSWYLEWQPSVISSNQRAGLITASSYSTWTENLSAFAGSIGYLPAQGIVVRNGFSNVTGLTNVSASERVGVRIRLDSGVAKATMYRVTAPGVSSVIGTEYDLNGTGPFSFCADNRDQLAETVFFCDSQELWAIPDGSQPWGCAARVADRGGYSPGATVFTDTDSDWTLDSFAKTATGTTTSAGIAICNDAPSEQHAFEYDEWAVETDTGQLGLIGLAPRGQAVSLSYPGSASGTFGFHAHNGTLYIESAATVSWGSACAAGDRIGSLREVSTGKWYVSINGVWQNSGDPEAGTGFATDTATGDLVPACSPRQGRLRLCTHAREQLYRPSYATARDGADLLPEQHFTDRIKQAPRVRREVSYYPWANQRNRGAEIGTLDLNNADGGFDALSDYDLRDQAVVAYVVREDGSTAREFTGIVDGITLPDFRTCRVSIADKTAALDVRVDAPVFALGAPELIPARARIGSTIAYDIAQSTFVDFRVYDQAAEVTSWVRSDVGDVSGFQRTVNPAGLHSVADFELVDEGTEATISNNSFDNWTAGNPDNWTKWDIGTAGTVVQSGSAAVITAHVGGDTGIYHALALTSGQAYLLRIKIDAISGVSTGNVSLCIENSAGSFLNLADGESIGPGTFTATGVFNVIFTPGSSFNGFSIYASLGASATVDYVQVWPVTQTTSTLDSIQYLMTLAGFSASDYVESFWPAYRPGSIGFWSEDRPTLRAILDQIAQTALVDYYTDADGVVRLAWLMPPEEVTIAADGYLGEIAERDVFGEISVADDYAPRLTTVAEYQRNYIPHSSADVAGSVFTANKPWASYVQSERRENQLDVSSVSAGEAGPLHPFYAFANDAPVWPRLFVDSLTDSNTKNDASATTDNRLILLHRCYMQRRRFYRCRISRAKASDLGLRPAGVVDLTHNRYGLSGGKNLMVVGIEASLMTPTVAVTLWG